MADTCFTYTANPAIPLDVLRGLIGDTDPDDPIFTDDELRALLALYNDNPALAAPAAALSASAKFARLSDVKIGQVDKKLSQIAEAFRKLHDDLVRDAARSLGVPFYAGGLSRAEKITDAQDSDLVQPAITKGIMDNPRAARQTGTNELRTRLGLE